MSTPPALTDTLPMKLRRTRSPFFTASMARSPRDEHLLQIRTVPRLDLLGKISAQLCLLADLLEHNGLPTPRKPRTINDLACFPTSSRLWLFTVRYERLDGDKPPARRI